MQEKGDRARSASPSGESVIIRVRLTPRSSRNAVVGRTDGVFRIKLTAPPVEGKANQALIAFLAKALRIPKRAIGIVSGEKSREKTLSIEGLTAMEVESALIKPT